jgi:photosystem II stability/assembly factor-like uncharacterized protein
MKPADRLRLRAALDAEYPPPHPSLTHRVLPPRVEPRERRLGGAAAMAAVLVAAIVVVSVLGVVWRSRGIAAPRPAAPLHTHATPTRSAAPAPDPTVPAAPGIFAPAWFVSADVGWEAIDGSLQRTADGGAHWTPQLTLEYPKLFARDMRFLDAQTGAVMPIVVVGGRGESALYVTTDGGQHWTRRTVPATAHPASGMDFVSAGEGYVLMDAGSGPAVFHTVDGGGTWQQVALLPSGVHLEGMRFLDAAHGWIAATSGGQVSTLSYLATTDGGHTWDEEPFPGLPVLTPPAPSFLETPRFTDPLHGFATFAAPQPAAAGATPGAGKFGTQAVFVYATSDGGRTWSPVGASPGGSLAFAVLDERDVLVVTDTAAIVSRDRGATWQQLGTLPGRGSWVDFPNPRDGFAGDPGSRALLVTHDGGRTWTSVG